MGTATAAGACLYLLLRRANAFAPDVTPPQRLRRWTAVFFAVMALGHLWYIPSVVSDSSEDFMLGFLIGGLLDCILVIPLPLVVMLCMLQDRRRPLWPVGVTVAPLVVGVVVCIVTRSGALMPWLHGYFLLAAICFTIYMVRAVRHYGRWLRDNYADLEHKEVWQSFVVLAVIMLMFCYYVVGYDGSMFYEYIIQMCGLLLVVYLLWRVETLQTLTQQTLPVREGSPEVLSDATSEQIDTLLQQRCVDTRLYQQHGLTLSQLAQVIGTNRTYLGLYFVRQNTNYNTYINGLRIQYFLRLYDETVAAGRDFTAQQLASESGYRSYRTFSLAFKQRMGQSVTEWMSDQAG
jgi:AraC-like DNA-binding protein